MSEPRGPRPHFTIQDEVAGFDERRCDHAEHLEAALHLPPAGWRRLQGGDDGQAVEQVNRAGYALGLRVITSVAIEGDGNCWLHVSCSREERLPSWSDLRLVKDTFCGRDEYAYVVLPPPDRYVNLAANVHHLWRRLTAEPPLPEFSAVVAGQRTI